MAWYWVNDSFAFNSPLNKTDAQNAGGYSTIVDTKATPDSKFKKPRWDNVKKKWEEGLINYLPFPGNTVNETQDKEYHLNHNWPDIKTLPSVIIANKGFTLKYNSQIDVVHEGVNMRNGSNDLKLGAGSYIFHYLKGVKAPDGTDGAGSAITGRANTLRVQYMDERTDTLSHEVEKIKKDIIDLTNKKLEKKTIYENSSGLKANKTGSLKLISPTSSTRENFEDYGILELTFQDKHRHIHTKIVNRDELWYKDTDVSPPVWKTKRGSKAGYSDWFDEVKYPYDVIHRESNQAATYSIMSKNTIKIDKTAGDGLYLTRIDGFKSTPIKTEDININLAANNELKGRNKSYGRVTITNDALKSHTALVLKIEVKTEYTTDLGITETETSNHVINAPIRGFTGKCYVPLMYTRSKTIKMTNLEFELISSGAQMQIDAKEGTTLNGPDSIILKEISYIP